MTVHLGIFLRLKGSLISEIHIRVPCTNTELWGNHICNPIQKPEKKFSDNTVRPALRHTSLYTLCCSQVDQWAVVEISKYAFISYFFGLGMVPFNVNSGISCCRIVRVHSEMHVGAISPVPYYNVISDGGAPQ